MLSHKDFGKTGLNTAFTHFSYESVISYCKKRAQTNYVDRNKRNIK